MSDLPTFQFDEASRVEHGAALPIGRSAELSPFRAPYAGRYVLAQPGVWDAELRRALRRSPTLPATTIAAVADPDWPLSDTAYVLDLGGGRYLWTIPRL
ncbi:hypothetical protein [Herbaspirillum sp.]|uniref:hypothetical protein n=1 Tax=Herbaspirillum sp. TaxID=1890675 RepID=UPI000C0F9EC6|nr:hypothetical protein [Herbaspirillum sp.]MBO13901.1 hypothetical protein [Herbaspirillum sp.]